MPFILNLLRRARKPGQLNFHGIVVGTSRGTEGRLMRTLYNDGDLDYIAHLLPPPELLAFEAGWADGHWNFQRCREELERIKRERCGLPAPAPHAPPQISAVAQPSRLQSSASATATAAAGAATATAAAGTVPLITKRRSTTDLEPSHPTQPKKPRSKSQRIDDSHDDSPSGSEDEHMAAAPPHTRITTQGTNKPKKIANRRMK